MNYKKLEKKMTNQELEEYLSKHPEWRIPTIKESSELSVQSCYRVQFDGKLDNGLSMTTHGVYSDNMKFDVVLVQSVPKIKRARKYYFEPGDCHLISDIRHIASEHFNINCLNKIMLKVVRDASNGKVRDKLNEILKIMNDNDVFHMYSN